MTNLDRNTRTLIVCFSIALMALIPLRFVEAGQQVMMYQSQVLGESAERRVVPVVKKNDSAKLQAPYDKIDGALGDYNDDEEVDCLMEEEVRGLVEEVTMGLVMGDYTEVEVRQVLEEVETIEKRLCR